MSRPSGMSAAFVDVLFLLLVVFMVNLKRAALPTEVSVPEAVDAAAAQEPLEGPRLTIEPAGAGVAVRVNGRPVAGDLLAAVAPHRGRPLVLAVSPGAAYGPTAAVIERLKAADFTLVELRRAPQARPGAG
ncbi:MAG: biopolymer transporter ExbD [Myxococcales bacterium]|nr:biopolymer transporter ExbD [Myxococcales bacterium]